MSPKSFMSTNDSHQNSQRRQDDKADSRERPENINNLDKAADAEEARTATAKDKAAALALNKDQHTGSAGGQGGSIEVVAVDKHGKQQVLVSRETGTSKDFSKFSARAQHISEAELERMAASGDGFAKDVMRQLKTADSEEKRATVQKNADRMYGRAEFALPKEEKRDAKHQPDTGILEAIKHDETLPKERRILAEQIQEMRLLSKQQGISTDVIDQYAASELQTEIDDKASDLEVAKALAAGEDTSEAEGNKLYDYTKPNSISDAVQEIANVGIDKFSESELRGKLKVFEDSLRNLTGPKGNTPLEILKGGVVETVIEGTKLEAGIGLGCERFMIHTVEGLVSLARMGDALYRRTNPIGWIYDPDPEGTKMLVNTMTSAAAMERMLLQFSTTLNPTSPLFGCEFDPEGTAAAKKVLVELPALIERETVKFGQTDNLNKAAVGTEVILNIGSLFVGGGAGVVSKSKTAAELANVAKANEFVSETGQGFQFFKLFAPAEKLSIPETFTEASLTTLQKYTLEIGQMAKTNRSLETLYQGLNKTLDQMIALVDRGVAKTDKLAESARQNELIDKVLSESDKLLKLPGGPKVLPEAASSENLGYPIGKPEEGGLGKIIDNVLMMSKNQEPLPIKFGDRKPEIPKILSGNELPRVPESGWKEPLFLTGDDELMTVDKIIEHLDISRQRLAKMSPAELEEHNLIRLSPKQADVVVQERLRNQFAKILELSDSDTFPGKVTDATASIRKILIQFEEEILERNIAPIIVKHGDKEELFFAVNNKEKIPGTIPPQTNRLFPHAKDYRSRANDSEAKAANFVGELFEDKDFSRITDEARKPNIWMLSEQAPCDPSCKILIEKAKEWFAKRGIPFISTSVYPDKEARQLFVMQKFLKWSDK